EEALSIDPSNARAEAVLAEVRLILGDSKDLVASDYFRSEQLRRDYVRAEVRRALAEGMNYEELDDYDRALSAYRRAVDLARNEPFDLQLDAEIRQAQVSIERAEQKQSEHEERSRLQRLREIEEQRRAQADDSIAYLKTQIRELHRRAQVAQEAKEFKKAARLYEQILALNPQ